MSTVVFLYFKCLGQIGDNETQLNDRYSVNFSNCELYRVYVHWISTHCMVVKRLFIESLCFWENEIK